MTELVEPHDSGMMRTPDGHEVYWEAVGDPHGTPALYLHGGPGSGAGPAVRQRFDSSAYNAVLLDQRGCGRSRPLADPPADLASNTTAHLLADVEQLREHLGIERWVVHGVSWGVTLALAYAQRHPDRVRAMVLAAVTAGASREIEWITWEMGRVFPREWGELVARAPGATTGVQVCAAYAELLADPDPAVRDDAARAWCAWEDTHVSLMPGWEPDPRFEEPGFRERFARLVTHYWSNGCFLDDGELLRGAHRLAGIPAVLIHGRYDVSGPLDTAWQLHRAWPGSELVVVGDAGHGGGSFGREVVRALDRFRSAP